MQGWNYWPKTGRPRDKLTDTQVIVWAAKCGPAWPPTRLLDPPDRAGIVGDH